MNAPTKLRMTADEFLRWAMEQPEGKRHELVEGEVIRMAPERIGHVEIKALVWLALREAVRISKLHCQVLIDGVAVRIGKGAVYEPDALVRCGEPLDKDAIEVNDPVIVVEVLSPSTQSVDTGAKFVGYFRLPSVQHYLIVDRGAGVVVHHRRGVKTIETRIVESGPLSLDPPGISIQVESFFLD